MVNITSTKMRFIRRLCTFKPKDVALIRQVTRPDKVWLTTPLTADGKQGVSNGTLLHSEILNTRPGASLLVNTRRAEDKYLVSHPTLDEYILLSRRAATPIYAYDASAIVDLADIHIDYPAIESDEAGSRKLAAKPLQFLEAGSGHGSLSLAVARAIHSGNCHAHESLGLRGAVLHSIDNNESQSAKARKTVNGFRRGMYNKDVEFHISESPSHWLDHQSDEWRAQSLDVENELNTDTAFLSGAFLDMPSLEVEFETLSRYLLHGSYLIVFCPSVTQVLDCLKVVRESNYSLGLSLIKTYELQSSGLKEWDLRASIIRSTNELAYVCRPKVGIRTFGGGFVGVFKKVKGSRDTASVEETIGENL